MRTGRHGGDLPEMIVRVGRAVVTEEPILSNLRKNE
jgi:hypothetical protein